MLLPSNVGGPVTTTADAEDMYEIVSEMSELVGPDVDVKHVCQVREAREVAPQDGVAWIYFSRGDV